MAKSYRLFPAGRGAEATPDRYLIKVTLDRHKKADGFMREYFNPRDLDLFLDALRRKNPTAQIEIGNIDIRPTDLDIHVVFDVVYYRDLDLFHLFWSCALDSLVGRWTGWDRDYPPLKVSKILVQKLITSDLVE